MAQTVNDAFKEFNKDAVNLITERTKIARDSRDWLILQLLSLPDKVEDFPRLYNGMHIKYGSFARNTKISPLDDIDLILTFSAEGTTYKTISYGMSYQLLAPESATALRKYCNDDNTLNSIKLINKVVSALNKIEQYKSADKHRNQEAATLSLNSYEWIYDIVPALYTDMQYYLIPDGAGGWKATDPRIDQDRIDAVNQKHSGRVLQLIRTLKYWNRRAAMTTIPSYLFETMILIFSDSQSELSDYVDINLIRFWNYLRTEIYYDVNDPKGFQGNLNSLSSSERLSIATKCSDAYDKGLEAYKIETEEKNQSKSINKWIEIFGNKFQSMVDIGKHIITEQNSDRSIKYLASQKQIYSNAKLIFLTQVIIAVPIPVLISIITPLLNKSEQGIALAFILYSIIATFLEVILDERVANLKQLAASIKEKFDCSVLVIEWNRTLISKKPEEDIILRYYKQHIKKKALNNLYNWYSTEVEMVKTNVATFLCQRINCKYDFSLRRRYANTILLIALLTFSVLFIVSLFYEITLASFITNVASPSVPIFLLTYKQVTGNREAINNLTELKDQIENEMETLVVNDNVDIRLIRQIQDKIYLKRLNSPLLPEWIYAILRDKLEEEMNFSVKEKITELNK